MKGLILSSLVGLIVASVGCSYASTIRLSAVNESAGQANIIITGPTAKQKVIALGSADATLMTADYTYPAPIMVQTPNQFAKPCKWTSPPFGKQTISSIEVTISKELPNSIICLLDWH